MSPMVLEGSSAANQRSRRRANQGIGGNI